VIVVGNVPIAVHVLEITAALALMEIVVPEKTAIHVMDVIAARVREETAIMVQEIQTLPLTTALEVTAITVQEIRLHPR